MGDLSKSLSRWEIECPCGCNEDTHDHVQVQNLQDCVDHFQDKYQDKKIAIHINSGNRCPEYNSTIKGASRTSQHTHYKADDFFLYDKNTGDYKTGDHIDDDEVADYLESKHSDSCGIGRYNGRTHLDSRSTMTRWDRR